MEDSINQRIRDIIHALKLNPNSFAKSLGVANTVIYNIVSEDGRQNKPSFDLLSKIIKSYDSINPTWLLTGEGEMFKEELKKLPSAPRDNGQYGTIITDLLMKQLEEKDAQLKEKDFQIRVLLDRLSGKLESVAA
jgi:hypothetical protein